MGHGSQSGVSPSGQMEVDSGRWSDGGGVQGEDEKDERGGAEGWRLGRQWGAGLHKGGATLEEGEGTSDPDREQQSGGRGLREQDQWRMTHQ